jgi:hypothetical protein
MNLLETFYIQQLHHMDKPIREQESQETNSLYTLGSVPPLQIAA